MKRSLAEWASIAEIISGVAVVVTLIVLIQTVRENSNIVLTSTYASNLNSHNEHSIAIMSNPELLRVSQAFVSQETADLPANAGHLLQQHVMTLFRNYEQAFFFNEADLLGDSEWERNERLICINFDRSKAAGLEPLLEGVMTSDFFEFMSNCPSR